MFRILLFLITCLSLFCNIVYAAPKRIGIIVPLEHAAMGLIVEGIKEGLSGENVEIMIKNAQGDSNIMLALIKQMNDQHMDILMPIGTMASQMTISHIHNKPVIAVASSIKASDNEFVTGFNDEVPVSAVIKQLPKLHKLALFYSASEKVMPEVEELKIYAKEHNIKLHLSMIQTLAELPLAVKNVPADTEAFLILKDHLIVSGINILTQEALKKSLPVIASDQGSVMQGATIAIGVEEKEIGLKAAAIAKLILQGAKPASIPYQTIDTLVLFINTDAFKKQNILTEKDIQEVTLPHIEFNISASGKGN